MTTAPHNFSRVSARDALAFGSSRPGFPSKQVGEADISAWVQFMKEKGIQHILSLLGDDEKEEFFPGLDIDSIMKTAFGDSNYTRTSVFAPDSRQIISDAFARAKRSQQPIVMHCSGGEGRAALAMMLWLIDSYNLAPEDAAREIEEEKGRNDGIARRTSVPKVVHLIKAGTMTEFS